MCTSCGICLKRIKKTVQRRVNPVIPVGIAVANLPLTKLNAPYSSILTVDSLIITTVVTGSISKEEHRRWLALWRVVHDPS
ncbi:hypothetical protein LINPERHAP2_LOCUS10313 [Linum perenne]